MTYSVRVITDRMRRVLLLRRSSAARPARSKKAYLRKPKHTKSANDE